MAYIVIDFETRSAADLKKVGAWVYAEHPTTEPICLGYNIDGGGAKLWLPSEQFPDDLRAAIQRPDNYIVAHNCQFEKAIWYRLMIPQFNWPDIRGMKWIDTMAVCARKVIPLRLEHAGRILNLDIQKDKEGAQALSRVHSPNKKTSEFNRDQVLLDRVYSYCKTDVDTEDRLLKRVGTLSKTEQVVWEFDQLINERGIRLDLPFVRQAQKVIDGALIPLAAEFSDLTGGLTASQRDKVLAWLHTQGTHLPNMQKDVVEGYLSQDEDDIPETALRALKMRQKLTSASIKKLDAMRRCVGADGRARGLLQYHAAGPGRWGGRILQPQNFPRGTVDLGKDEDGKTVTSVDSLVPAIMSGDHEIVQAVAGCAVDGVSSSLRHALIAAPGHVFCAGDFSTIEARFVLAIAGQHDKLELMASGADIYCAMATQIYGFDVNKKDHPVERQIGKNSVLGLGFQMGAPKFKLQTKKQTGIVLELEFSKEVVATYREEFAPRVPKVWYGLEEAACKTVWDRRPHEAFGILYALEDAWLVARLPSGRKLYYFNPKPVKRPMPWDDTDIRPGWTYQATKSGQWKTIDAYGGLLTENVVQASARDLMVDRMVALEMEIGYPTVLTVHDEVVSEVPEFMADPKLMQQVMEDTPLWAKSLGIPVAAECWAGERYRK